MPAEHQAILPCFGRVREFGVNGMLADTQRIGQQRVSVQTPAWQDENEHRDRLHNSVCKLFQNAFCLNWPLKYAIFVPHGVTPKYSWQLC